MLIEKRVASLFKMTDEVWGRHANPLSVWTRYITLPFLVLILWFRLLFGYWSWLIIVAAIFWIWWNPRLFLKPRSIDNWASKCVLGERFWLNRKEIPLPAHHEWLPGILGSIGSLGLIPLVYGLINFDCSLTVWSLMLIMMMKTWFLDRMVWIFEDMKSNDEYAAMIVRSTQST